MKTLHELITETWGFAKAIYSMNPSTEDYWRKVIKAGNDMIRKFSDKYGEASKEYIFIRKMVVAVHAYVEADLKESK